MLPGSTWAWKRIEVLSWQIGCGAAPSLQAVILQQQVKAQAEKDVANYEAEWRKLTELIEQDRRQRVRGRGVGGPFGLTKASPCLGFFSRY